MLIHFIECELETVQLYFDSAKNSGIAFFN